MCNTPATALCVLVLALASAPAWPAPPQVAAFARRGDVEGVAISPDGRYVSWLSADGDKRVVLVHDRSVKESVKAVMASGDKEFDVTWCSWANKERLLCGFSANVREAELVYTITRLVAVNADGSKTKVLMQNSSAGGSQFQDEILDWTPADPDTVLIAAQGSEFMLTDPMKEVIGTNVHEFPSVFELNVYNGKLRLRLPDHGPIRRFVSDAHGNVRIGSGISDLNYLYFAKLDGDSSWRQLVKFEAFSRADQSLIPIAVGRQPNTMYAMGSSDGRKALWEIDLTDRVAPQIVFSHPQVDVDRALFERDGRMIGVFYELDRPFVHYTDPHAQLVMDAVNKSLPGTFNTLEDSTPDEKVYVIRAMSDVDAGTYYVLDTTAGRMERLGSAYPELVPQGLAHMRSVAFAARDGTRIPGYLTVPPGAKAEHLPLIVMPHGGPIARDSWEFDFLLQFLVSRGYAVLQMNFRGSGGFGDDWYWAAHQDWGGLTYDDITDGARWVVKEGIADPKRMCIVGWSFGGYAALLGAVRNSDLYRCSVSIAGVSDLTELEFDARKFVGGQIARKQIGTDSAKLKADSPRRHAETVNIPILMIHGDRDANVEVDQSQMMAKALDRANKPYEFIRIKGATHYMQRASERVTLLTAIEKFLATNLGPGVTTP
jgi:dipeptidyl aminopeptidase/acylaminoacyl peptidase